MRIWQLGSAPLQLCGWWILDGSRCRHGNAGCHVRLLVLHILLALFMLSPASAASYPQTVADALYAVRLSAKNSTVLTSWASGDPCLSKWKGVECANDSTITSLKLSNMRLTGTLSPLLGNLMTLTTLWLDSNFFVGPIPPQLGDLRNLTSLRLSNNSLSGSIPASLSSLPNLKEIYLSNNDFSGSIPFNQSAAKAIRIIVDGNDQLCTLEPGYDLPVCPPALAPSLVFGPVASIADLATSHRHVAAIASGVAGCVLLVAVIGALVFCCLYQAKSWSGATSDIGSDPSAQVDWAKGPEAPLVGGQVETLPESSRTSKIFSLDEMEHATKNFSMNNMIGEGSFGYVYKGLLEDGSIVAIKSRSYRPSQEFAMEVDGLARIQHRHLVSVLGFCQENDQQMVVYDYLPHGSVSAQLYDTDGIAMGKLDFKQRLVIALGAAKGLDHLHNLMDPLVHRDFKSNNVLLDANLDAKVTDFGLSRLLAEGRLLQEGPILVSSASGDVFSGFIDPEYDRTGRLTVKSDVYSFGVFLLELISGREAISANRPAQEWSLVDWGRTVAMEGNWDRLVDESLESNFNEAVMKAVLDVCFRCVESGGERRPTMGQVVVDLEDALEREKGLAVGGGDATTVTLGSELFQ